MPSGAGTGVSGDVLRNYGGCSMYHLADVYWTVDAPMWNFWHQNLPRAWGAGAWRWPAGRRPSANAGLATRSWVRCVSPQRASTMTVWSRSKCGLCARATPRISRFGGRRTSLCRPARNRRPRETSGTRRDAVRIVDRLWTVHAATHRMGRSHRPEHSDTS
jgi:hypothetical protein